MNVGSLFSGIGGFDLGLERAGMRTIWQVEIDSFRRAVLARRFPDAERFADVRGVGVHDLAAVDLICGGFPCQDLSVAGKGAGIDGARSGLWAEFARIVDELRPCYVLVENVPNLLVRGFERVLGDLAALGYDAEWDCLSASAFGAPHRRDRVWLVAYPSRNGEVGTAAATRTERERVGAGCEPSGTMAHPSSPRQLRAVELEDDREGERAGRGPDPEPSGQVSGPLRNPGGSRLEGDGQGRAIGDSDWWSVEPDVGRVAHGVPNRVDRLAALGDALVPQIAEWIGRRILEWERVAA